MQSGFLKRCENCDKLNLHSTEQKWLILPNVLIIRLERSETSKFVEVEPSIQLEIDGATFDLRAVITHHGESTKRGHITTSLYNGKGLWTTCNDKRVSNPSKDKPKFGLVYIYDRNENALNVPLKTQMEYVTPSDLKSPVLKKTKI